MGTATMSTVVTSAQAARHLGVTQSQLAYMRQTRTGPDWGKVGGSIRYDLEDLDRWLQRRADDRQSDAGAVSVKPGHDDSELTTRVRHD